ncbi:MAG: NFACT family protein, partial [Anaerolineales bacterium]|nr:NFACT family protein [Anaerolineales bacterium]
MYFDALTMAAVADELRAQILGGRVQNVLLPDDLSVGMEVYAHGERRYLLGSAHPEYARLHLTGEKLRRGVEKPTPLVLLLRKYVRGGRIAAIEQPPFERILHIGMQHPEGNTTLIFEVMGRYSNIVLVAEEGLILECIKRVGPEKSRYRTILPQRLYVPPPPQSKLDPTDVTELRLRDILSNASPGSPVWKALVAGIRGVSPLMAREVVYRAMGDAEAAISQVAKVSPLLEAFQEMLMPVWEHRWQPSIVKRDERLVAFAPYPLTQYGDWEEVESISQAVEAYYGQMVGEDAYAAAKRGTREAILRARERVRRKQEALERSRVSQAQVEELRRRGEMILAYAHRIEPGQRELMAPVRPDEPPLLIELDPHLSPVENAQRYFVRYKKAKSAAGEIPALLQRAELEMRYLDQLETDLALAANRLEIQEVEASLAEAGYIREKRRRRKVGRSQPLAVNSQDGLLILVGRNSRQNEEVTFRRAAPNDLWLHVRGAPGAHVIVKTGGREVPEATLRQAAQLAAYYSQARGSTRVDVAYTERRYVRPIKGAGPGLVT